MKYDSYILYHHLIPEESGRWKLGTNSIPTWLICNQNFGVRELNKTLSGNCIAPYRPHVEINQEEKFLIGIIGDTSTKLPLNMIFKFIKNK